MYSRFLIHTLYERDFVYHVVCVSRHINVCVVCACLAVCVSVLVYRTSSLCVYVQGCSKYSKAVNHENMEVPCTIMLVHGHGVMRQLLQK